MWTHYFSNSFRWTTKKLKNTWINPHATVSPTGVSFNLPVPERAEGKYVEIRRDKIFIKLTKVM